MCGLAAWAQADAVRAGLPAGQNSHYTGNRPPLRPLPLVKLPAGAIEPGGRLGEQLRLMAEGFSGQLPALSEFCKYGGNAWTTPGGHGRFGWEELPYWLKGYINLGYVLADRREVAARCGAREPRTDGGLGGRHPVLARGQFRPVLA